ncbi:MAG TPA: LysR family transcriptional regulator [Xanthobacteraceae bacterium]|nr:LysR family transcriptional regulator [Xanthobacteraceae bacterium]
MDRFKLMDTFVTVVKLGSYTNAAKQLGVTRAMASKRVQELEASLGLKLLNRNTRRLSPTGAGKDYFDACMSILEAVRTAEDRLIGKRSGARGELKILCSKTFGEMLLSPIISEFCEMHPNISVQLAIADMRPDGNEIVGKGFDLAIRTLPIGESRVVARAIASLPRVLVASARYLAQAGTPTSPEQLTAHNCLDPRGVLKFSWQFLGPNGRRTLKLRGSLAANSSTIVLQAALQGLGIAMMRRYLVQAHLARRSLIPVLEDFTISDDKLYVVYQKDKYQPARARIFIDYLTARVNALLSDTTRVSAEQANILPPERRPLQQEPSYS